MIQRTDAISHHSIVAKHVLCTVEGPENLDMLANIGHVVHMQEVEQRRSVKGVALQGPLEAASTATSNASVEQTKRVTAVQPVSSAVMFIITTQAMPLLCRGGNALYNGCLQSGMNAEVQAGMHDKFAYILQHPYSCATCSVSASALSRKRSYYSRRVQCVYKHTLQEQRHITWQGTTQLT